MMLSVLITLAANQVTELSLAGNYFELRAAPYAVSVVELTTRDGGVISTLENVEATDKVKTPRKFDKIRLTNGATAQTIRVYYGEGETGSNRFTGVVSGTVDLSAPSMAVLTGAKYAVRPEVHTHAGSDSVAMAANIPQTYVLAAQNTNGMIVQYLLATDRNAGTPDCRGSWLAKATAPANVNDGVPLAGFEVTGANAGNVFFKAELKNAVFVPAGLGLHWIQDTLSTGGEKHQWRALIL